MDEFDNLAGQIGETDYNGGDLNQLRNDLLKLVEQLRRGVMYEMRRVVNTHLSSYHYSEV